MLQHALDPIGHSGRLAIRSGHPHAGRDLPRARPTGISRSATPRPILAAIVLVAFIVVCSPLESNEERALRIAGALYLGDVPTLIADELNFFEAHGLDVELSAEQSGRVALDRLRRGEVDFAMMALTPIVLDRLADESPGQFDDPVILASVVDSSELIQLVAHGGAEGVDTPSDLVGRRIAIVPGTNSEFTWWIFRKFHDLEDRSVEVVPLDPPDMVAAFAEGRIDAALAWEPWLTRLEDAQAERGGSKPQRFDLRQMYSGKWLVVTSRQTAGMRTETCERVLAALREAIRFMERNPERATQIVSERFGITGEVLAEHWTVLDYDLNLDWALISGLQEQFHWAVRNGYPNRDGPVQTLDLIDDRALRAIWPAVVGIPSSPGTPDRP